MSHDRTHSGFKDRTRVADARERLLAAAAPHGRTETVPLTAADGRAVADATTAPTPVPGYDRAAMDGWAVRAEDTFGASARSPAVLFTEDDEVAPEGAVRVHTGSELPPGADAVVKIEEAERVPRSGTAGSSGEGTDPRDEIGEEVEVFDAVAEGENVGPTGEDVAEGQTLYEPPHRLRPSDLGLLKSVGIDEVEVAERPRVSVIPTGEELVQADPDPGEVIETNGLTVSRLAERWGGDATYRDIVTDDEDALRGAVERDLDHDVVVTTGGSSVGERDLIPEVVDEIGEVLVHGVALKPGHPVALGVVEGTPVIMLPGYPVACIVNAVQFLRPVIREIGSLPHDSHPTQRATLSRKVSSEPGVRTFARVTLDPIDGRGADTDGAGDAARDGDGPAFEATPTRASGSGMLSSVALADGWVVVPESREGLDAGEAVDVELWEVSE
ncbi:molybdopterin molybdotransferase MoeA [Halobaculum magnesiiphilum]|uniref:Molybdopterin molybdotransferase MoeA n=1 Tax=Halobaculum magnesiiphilum TaxID=1017351 RepID=A0A8T8WG39_9EURY|nr:molybdopterin molybdotransferase MoeA [Halobaculum magnesiiphilum]QZP38801.1 molybdopterin molybdotransferase MoeA [Halobaculum magnesiiphilum]